MKYHNFSLYKDYDQMQHKEINENPFGLEIIYSDLEKNKNLRVFMTIWNANNAEDKRKVQILRDVSQMNKLRYNCRIPFDNIENETYCFRLTVVNEANKTLKTSSTQTILPVEQVIPPNIKDELAYDYVQGILVQIDSMNNDSYLLAEKVNGMLEKLAEINQDMSLVLKEWVQMQDIDTTLESIIHDSVYYASLERKRELEEELMEWVNSGILPSLESFIESVCKANLDDSKEELESFNSEVIEESLNTLTEENMESLTQLQGELSEEIDTRLVDIEDGYNTRLEEVNANINAKVEEDLATYREQINTDVNEKLESLLTNLDNILGTIVNTGSTMGDDAEIIEEDDDNGDK